MAVLAQGGPYDGIITINSASAGAIHAAGFGGQFRCDKCLPSTRSTKCWGRDLTLTSHPRSVLPHIDLFSWASLNARNTSASGQRFFSIDQGFHLLAQFNQNPDGDFGDYDSDDFCPATRLYVQNAFNCAGQSTDISATSPEGISLDVIGYDLGVATETGSISIATANRISCC